MDSQKAYRCFVCQKKVGILPFTCKCDTSLFFCAQHRYPEDHGCTFDHKHEFQEKLQQVMPHVAATKIEKI